MLPAQGVDDCPECDGYGWQPKDDRECPLCEGTGNRFGLGPTKPVPSFTHEGEALDQW